MLLLIPYSTLGVIYKCTITVHTVKCNLSFRYLFIYDINIL
jgi:hypothetical protein